MAFIRTSRNGIDSLDRKHLDGLTLLGGAVKGSEFDYFHDMIVAQELVGIREFSDGNLSGLTISIPVILVHAADEQWKNKIVSE